MFTTKAVVCGAVLSLVPTISTVRISTGTVRSRALGADGVCVERRQAPSVWPPH